MRNPEEQAQFEAEEKRMAGQAQYDPTKHGAGTMSPKPVADVSGLSAHLGDMEKGIEYALGNIHSRLGDLEQKSEVLASGAYNMIVNRIENLEKMLTGLTDGLHALNAQAASQKPAEDTTSNQNEAASPFGKKK